MNAQQEALLRKGMKGLLRPAVAFAVRRSFRIQVLIEMLKEVFLEVIEEELDRANTPVTVSKLSAATGLQRKDITRLRSGHEPKKQNVDLLTRVLGAWQGNTRYQTKSGKPKTLTLEGKSGTFADLVRSVSSDLNPYTVLFELERSQIVEKDEKGIHLVRRAYQPKGDIKLGLQLLEEDSVTLMESVSENIFAKEKRDNLHIRTSYDNIDPRHEEELRKWCLLRGKAFHEEARTHLSELDRDLHPGTASRDSTLSDGRLKVSVVTFSFTEKIDDSTSTE